MVGALRLERALALAGATMAGLLATRIFAPRVSAYVNARASLQRLSTEMTYRGQVRLGQFGVYLAALALGFGAAALWASIAPALRRRRSWERAADVVAILAPVGVAAVKSSGFALMVAGATLGGAILLAPQMGGTRAPRATSGPRLASFVVLAELLAACWALFLVLVPRGAGVALALPVMALCVFAGRRMRRGRTALDALAGSPLLLLPLLAFSRAPSPWILVGAAAVVVAFRAWLGRARGTQALPPVLASVIAPTALASILMIPLGLRDLPSSNYGEHESFNLAWINSALHGKLLWADAGLVHGPLRDYLMLAILSPFGVDFGHVRVAFVTVNVVGVALTMPVIWWLARRNAWLHALGAYLVLVQTPARTILWYRHMTSLGWADLTRTALPALALFGAMGGSRADEPASGPRAFGFGLLMGVSLLYSQEFGICAALGVLFAASFDRLVRGTGPASDRAKMALRAALPFSAGFLAPPLALFAIYSALGRGRLLLQTAYESVAFAASGVWSSLTFPIDEETITQPSFLFREFSDSTKRYDSAIVFLLPIAVYMTLGASLLARLALRRWTHRASTYLALFVFGITSYRLTVAAPDIYHLLSATLPAIFLLVGLSSDALEFRLWSPGGRFGLAIGAAAVLVLALASLAIGEFSAGITRRLAEVDSGEEKPASTQRHEHPDIPRAGDVFLPPATRAIVDYIRRETSPADPVFVCAGMFDGAEIYFLADRRNPSRFDTLSEIVNHARQAELLAALKRDPPELVIGGDTSFVGQEVAEYLQAGWQDAPSMGGYSVRRRRR
jgi:hypothetical protein